MRTLAVATGARSEYGVLRPLLSLLRQSPDIRLALVVAGMHLSERYGSTVNVIEADGYDIAGRVEMLLPENTPTAAARGLGKGVTGFAEAFDALKPGLLLVEGDRVEALAATLAAGYMNIPIAHSGGGDVTGTIDDATRHAISMFADLHFVSTGLARQVLLGFGIASGSIHLVGGLGIDALLQVRYSSRQEVLADLDLPLGAHYLLVAFHPDPNHHESCGHWMTNILKAASNTGLHVVVTYPNADPGSDGILRAIAEFMPAHQQKTRCFKSLGQVRYLNALKQADVLVGNSSSGLYEAPTLKVPVANVGDRQEGRLKAANVVDCSYEPSDIEAALAHALGDPLFRAGLADTENPYGDGHAAERMLDVVKEKLAQCTP